MNYQTDKTFLQLWQAVCDDLGDQGAQAILRDYLLECGESEPVATEVMARRVLRPKDRIGSGRGEHVYGYGYGTGLGYGSAGLGDGLGYGSGRGVGYGLGAGVG